MAECSPTLADRYIALTGRLKRLRALQAENEALKAQVAALEAVREQAALMVEANCNSAGGWTCVRYSPGQLARRIRALGAEVGPEVREEERPWRW